MTTTDPTRPRHARAEIRAFAKELRKGGWVCEGTDSSGHTIWSHSKASGTYKLPETPTRFSVRLARRDVLALLGEKPQGKRNAANVRKPNAPDAQVEASRRRHQQVRDAKLEALRQEQEAKRRRLAECDAIAAAERYRREIEALMRPGR
ncbi:hypothetical protein L2K70_04895 [Nocardioides KLBMP 9356]|uniref:HicA-like toxin n=1 Tax=Nocardioides potassii TaxID=2911371 RepID=A0ABS9H9E5_9ACTN|nr:hypothetical protein [Nocardioides potassii]MCF6376933.1 hypothetical protein [Nocardioides potassii]